MKYIILPASRDERQKKCSWCDENVTKTVACCMNQGDTWRELACDDHQKEFFPAE